jgi:hypothetical protein
MSTKYIPPYKLRMMQEQNAEIDAHISDISSKNALLKRAGSNLRSNKYVPPYFSGGETMPVQDCKYGAKCPFGLQCKFNHTKKQKQKFAEVLEDQPTTVVRTMKQQQIDSVRSQTYCKYGVNCTFAFECKFGHTEEERGVWEDARRKQEEEVEAAVAEIEEWRDPTEPQPAASPVAPAAAPVATKKVLKKRKSSSSVPQPVAVVNDDLLFQIKLAFVLMFGLCLSVIVGQLSAASDFDIGIIIGLAIAMPAFVYATSGWWNFQKVVPMADSDETVKKGVTLE